MLKQIRLIDWKSFADSIVYVDPLTVLIGTNASGKSNALDALSFMQKLVSGHQLQSIIVGETTLLLDARVGGIRGGMEWAARKPATSFTLEALVQDQDGTDYRYRVTVQTLPQIELIAESLHIVRCEGDREGAATKLFEGHALAESPGISVELYNGQGRSVKQEYMRSVSVISQLIIQSQRKKLNKAVECVTRTLGHIFILDPVPYSMRGYKPLTTTLANNASNLAGMLAQSDKWTFLLRPITRRSWMN